MKAQTVVLLIATTLAAGCHVTYYKQQMDETPHFHIYIDMLGNETINGISNPWCGGVAQVCDLLPHVACKKYQRLPLTTKEERRRLQ